MVAIISGNRSFCGGTLVASKYVISASHCFMTYINNTQIIIGPIDPSEVRVRIGDHNLNVAGETFFPEKTVGVVRLTHHPCYVTSLGAKGAQPWDLTVVELAETLDLDTYTPACMAKNTDTTTFDGKTATVAGWGLIAEGGSLPDPWVPQEVNLPVLPASQCPGLGGSPADICAGGEEGKGSCQVKLSFSF